MVVFIRFTSASMNLEVLNNKTVVKQQRPLRTGIYVGMLLNLNFP